MDTISDIIVKSTETADMTPGKQNLLKNLHKIYVCQNIHIDIWKRIDRYVKAISIYKNTYDK